MDIDKKNKRIRITVAVVFAIFAVLIIIPRVAIHFISEGYTFKRTPVQNEIITKGGYEDLITERVKLYGVKCKYIKPVCSSDNPYSRIRYHVFSSEKAAQKAFENMKAGLYDGYSCNDNCIEGYEMGVEDANVCLYAKINGKLIVSVSISFYNLYGVDDPVIIKEVSDITKAYTISKQFIEKNY